MYQAALLRYKASLLALQKRVILLENKSLRLPAKMPSQHGEDIVLAEFFDFKKTGYFIEVGAYDGVNLSNSYFFEALGWDGMLIEPNSDLFSYFKQKRPYSQHHNVAISDSTSKKLELSIVEGNEALSFSHITDSHKQRIEKLNTSIRKVEVSCAPLSSLLPSKQKSIDFISIDVEGAELEVLRSIDFSKHAPTVFVIEDNSQGSNQAVKNYLLMQGYHQAGRLECNVFYLHNSCSKSIKVDFI